MSVDWYYVEGEKRIGPVKEEELISKIKELQSSITELNAEVDNSEKLEEIMDYIQLRKTIEEKLNRVTS